MVSDLLKDNDDDEPQTDVPPEPASNESEEERRSPGAISTGTAASGLEVLEGRRAPPGLALLSTEAPPAGFSPWPTPAGDASRQHPSTEDSADEDDEADDERSHEEDGLVQMPPGCLLAPPGIGEPLTGIPPLPGTGAAAFATEEARQLWYAQLPSLGSANHFTGTCDRCCFHPKGRCLNGYNCQHCHFDHEKRKRKSKKKKGMDFESGPSVPTSPQDPAFPVANFEAPSAKAPTFPLAFPPEVPQDMYSAPPLPAFAFESTPLPESRGDFQSAPFEYLGEASMPGLEPRFPEHKRKEDYIRQLEAENRHLRSLLAHMRPGLALPPAPNHPQEAASDGGSLSYRFPETQNLSASAAPFCPSYDWNQPSGDASSRGFVTPQPEVTDPPEIYVNGGFGR